MLDRGSRRAPATIRKGRPEGGSSCVFLRRPHQFSSSLALVLLYVVLGCFVDGISMIYMTLPVVKAFGFDLIWFAVILTVLIELGQITRRSA